MADKSYRVIAPYVTLKMDGGPGPASVLGYYKGAIIDGSQIQKESLKRHLDRKMIEEFVPEVAEESDASDQGDADEASDSQGDNAGPAKPGAARVRRGKG